MRRESHRNRKTSQLIVPILFALLLLLLETTQVALGAGSLISPSTVSDATNGSRNLKLFIAEGRFWAFFSDGSNLVYSSSPDGNSWTLLTTIRTGVLHGSWFGVYFNGSQVAYAYAAGTPIFYRLGTPLANGTIQWVAPEQSFASGSSPSISFDSSGYVWVGFSFDGLPWIIRDANRDGTWANDTSVPFNGTAIQLSNQTGSWSVFAQPMSSGKMYVFYGLTYQTPGLSGRLITPGSPVPEEEIISSGQLRLGEEYSSVSYSNNVFVIYTNATGEIDYKMRPPAGPWSDASLVQSGTANSTYPALSLNTTSQTLIAFWANAPTNNVVYYKRCVGGTSCTWDATPTQLVDESADTSPAYPSAYWQDGVINSVHYIPIEYTTNSSTVNQWNVKFATLSWRTPPTAPRNLTAARESGNVMLDWLPPSVNGGSPITGYNIYRGTSAGGEGTSPLTTIGNMTSYLDTSTLGGVTYYYKVTALNSIGESQASNEANATPLTPPSTPRDLNATAGNSTITLNWQAPSANGGTPITSYKIYRSANSSYETFLASTSNATSFSDSTPMKGVTYYYKVTAVNLQGESPLSNEAHALILTVPSQPLNLKATSGNGKITLSWSPPVLNGGASINGYHIYKGTSAGNTQFFIRVGNQTTFTDTSFSGAPVYYYRVAATNILGEGAFSNEVSEPLIAGPSFPDPILFLLLVSLGIAAVVSLRRLRRIPRERHLPSSARP